MKLEAWLIVSVREEMQLRGWSQSELAKKAGVPYYTIRRMFDRQGAKVADIERVLDTLQLKVELIKEE